MADVVVSGTLQEILDKMYRIQGVIISRKVAGWTPFQEDERWEYFRQSDERVCPRCEEFGFQFDFSGDEMQSNFPDLVQRDGPTYTLVRPQVHVRGLDNQGKPLIWSTSPDAEGGCRCRVHWVDVEDTMAERLTEELQQVSS